ncbi:hypothetical protein M8C21_019874, partial [Ambrosia artemisiifolia]
AKFLHFLSQNRPSPVNTKGDSESGERWTPFVPISKQRLNKKHLKKVSQRKYRKKMMARMRIRTRKVLMSTMMKEVSSFAEFISYMGNLSVIVDNWP